MSDIARSPRRRYAAAAAFALTLFTAAPAAAHDELVGTTPSASASPAKAPEQVVLRFSEPPGTVGTQVTVKDASGKDWAAGKPTLSGSNVVTPLRSGANAGKYTVAWRVVSDDGHPVSGTLAYTVTTGSSAANTPDPSATAGSVADRPSSAQANRDSKVLTGILAAFLVIVLAGVAALLMKRQRR